MTFRRNRVRGRIASGGGRFSGRRGEWRQAALVFAIFAVALRILFPPGFMVANSVGASPYPVVICTGAGPAVLAPDGEQPKPHTQPARPQGQVENPHCVFSGPAAAPLAWGEPLTTAAAINYWVAASWSPAMFQPARTSTRPPLPPRGPPT